MKTKSHQSLSSDITDPIFNRKARVFARVSGVVYYIEPKTKIIFQEKFPSVEKMRAYLEDQYSNGVYRDYDSARQMKIQTGKIRLTKIINYGLCGNYTADIGCSTGAFIEATDGFGLDVKGYELSEKAISQAPADIRKKIVNADVNQHIKSSGKKYDLITAYDILEHMQDPRDFLKNLKEAMQPKGVLAISTPDTDHFLRFVLGPLWPMLQPMQHTVLFSKNGLRELLMDIGFSDIVIYKGQKVLTLRYLVNQVAEPSPKLGKFLKLLIAPLPSWILDRNLVLNISEMFVLCRSGDGKNHIDNKITDF